jgi:hypothetical protein
MPTSQQLTQQVQNLSSINPAQLNMQAKQYFEPIVKPLVEEGGQRFADFFSALPNELLNNQSGRGGLSPEAALANAMTKVGQYGGLYDSNLGLRNYYGTRAEEMGKVANDSLNSMYGRSSDLLKTVMSQEQATRDQQRWEKEMQMKRDQMAQENAARQQQLAMQRQQMSSGNEFYKYYEKLQASMKNKNQGLDYTVNSLAQQPMGLHQTPAMPGGIGDMYKSLNQYLSKGGQR